MKKMAAITLTSMMLLLATAMVVGAVDSVDIRGAVAGTVNGQSNLEGDSFAWNPQNFAGFYYDIKKDIGTETLVTSLTEGNKLSGDAPYGVTYTSTAQAKDYEFEDWGSYNVIGFQAEKYFAGYITNEDAAKDIFFKESTDENSLSSEQLEKILVDDDTEKTVTSGTPLKLEEGYELSIKSIDIDGNKVYLELSKDGSVVDSKVISPSKDGATMADKTYYYKNPVVGDQKKLVTVAAHFKNAFRGSDQNLATVDGLWQISGEATEVKADTQYDKMTIRSVDATNGVITMDNKDNAITLSKNKDSALMAGVNIKTADNDTLRYYIYKAVTIEGAAAPVVEAPAVEAAPAAEAVTAAAAVAETKVNESAVVAKEKVTEAATKAEEKVNASATEAKAAEKAAPGFESIFAITGLLAVAFLVLGRRE